MALDLTCASSRRKPAHKPGADLGEHGNFKRWHVKFREFTAPEGADPESTLKRLCELGHLWLRPDLHTKKQIMDKLVLEQFLISMPPEFQVLVRESGVESCEDLEELLRSGRRPQSIVSINGEQFLLQNPDVEMVESEARDGDDVNILCREPGSLVSETPLANGWEVGEEHQNLPATDEASSRRQQGQRFLPEATSASGDLWILSPEQNLDKNVTEDGDEPTACVAQEPQLLKGAVDPLGAGGRKSTEEGTSFGNMELDTPTAPVLRKRMSAPGTNREDGEKNRRHSQSRKPDNSQKSEELHEEATCLVKAEFLALFNICPVDSPKTREPNAHDSLRIVGPSEPDLPNTSGQMELTLSEDRIPTSCSPYQVKKQSCPPETVSAYGELESLIPEKILEKSLMGNGTKSTTYITQEPHLLKEADSVWANESGNRGEGTSVANVDADTPYSPVVERPVSTEGPNRRDYEENRGRSKRRKPNKSETNREGHNEGHTGLAQLRPTEHGALKTVEPADCTSPGTMGPIDHRVAKKQRSTKQSFHQCGFCEKLFTYKSQFDIHQRTHTGERPFKCSTCGKGFMQPSDLRVHNRIHTGEKPFKCDICSCQFSHDSTLRGHKRIHTKERPFVCQRCGKHFSHKGNLNVHQRIHTGQKPYHCSDCGLGFRQLGTFRRHKKIHMKVTSC
ncbi:zinc finger and SCAN domain-containing protein 5B-like isoform X3 [Echinops telfairi]|uniref:Zinc finger and SCAN domain-containing protein 5B-like isoform X3 n=1 Tax=Echinops telfairi TaxID=9371 RepID=A0AC55D937_ECHTE|nr:zinc finger and SCAN domain-containing protein 5B-like isoform X3 [Echinops telfairi]